MFNIDAKSYSHAQTRADNVCFDTAGDTLGTHTLKMTDQTIGKVFRVSLSHICSNNGHSNLYTLRILACKVQLNHTNWKYNENNYIFWRTYTFWKRNFRLMNSSQMSHCVRFSPYWRWQVNCPCANRTNVLQLFNIQCNHTRAKFFHVPQRHDLQQINFCFHNNIVLRIAHRLVRSRCHVQCWIRWLFWTQPFRIWIECRHAIICDKQYLF